MALRDDLLRLMNVSGLRQNVADAVSREGGPGVDPCSLAEPSLIPLLGRMDKIDGLARGAGVDLGRLVDDDPELAAAYTRMQDDVADGWSDFKRACVRRK